MPNPEAHRLEAQTPAQHQSEWLTAAEAASYLRAKPRTILLWARQGHIKGYILSGTERVTWRFLRSDLDATLTPPSVALTKRQGGVE
jgi:excisionase family DNA binding protein